MNKIISILLILTVAMAATITTATTSFANNPNIVGVPTLASQAPDAGKLLGQMSQALKKSPAIELTFDLAAADSKGAINGSLQGTVQAQGYSYKLINPDLEIYCDGKSKWILNKATQELTIFPNDTTQTDLVENPIGFLTSLSKANSQFTHPRKAVETLKPQGCKPVWQIELAPKSKYAVYKSLILAIEKESNLPCLIRYQSKDDSSFTINIKTIKPQVAPWPIANFQIPSSYLTQKDITIVDLR